MPITYMWALNKYFLETPDMLQFAVQISLNTLKQHSKGISDICLPVLQFPRGTLLKHRSVTD